MTSAARLRELAISVEVAAVAGLVCAIGWSVSLRGLLDRPGLDATREEIVAYYARPGAGGDVGFLLGLCIVATVGFLWFVGVIRARIGDRESRLVGTVFLGAAILLTGLVLVGASALAAPSLLADAGGQVPDPGAAAMFRSLAAVELGVFGSRVATLVMFSTASLGLRTGALPRWLVILSYVVGLAQFLAVTISVPVLLTFPAWIALVSIVLLVRRPQLPEPPPED